MKLSLGLACCLAVSSCVAGAPATFSSGESWTFPLVDPLNDGRLVVPVTIDGKGPFLFAIDPDSAGTVVDKSLGAVVDVPAKQGARLTSEQDLTIPTFYAQLPNFDIGTLHISLMRVGMVENDHFDADGRRIWGILGRDIIADSLVLTVDRDRGVARLDTHKVFVPPANAQVIKYSKLLNRGQNAGLAMPSSRMADTDIAAGAQLPTTTRYLVDANINGATIPLHLDLGDAPSQLRTSHWTPMKLSPTAVAMTLIDETGSRRDVTTDGIAAQVSVPSATGAPIARENIGFVPFVDGRWLSDQLEGTLGWDFFAPFVVSADWDGEKFYVAPRASSPDAVAQRLARWGSKPSQCHMQGCATATIVAGSPAGDGAGPSAAQPSTIHVERDPALADMNLELVLTATGADGHALPELYVDIDSKRPSLDAVIDDRYVGAQLQVTDLSPFPHVCPNSHASCVRIVPPNVP